MAFQPTTKTTPDPDEIILFEGKDYTGDAYFSSIGDNIDIYKNFRPLNDKLYSVRVGSASKTTLFRDAGFSGPTLETTADVPSIALGGPGSGLSSFIVHQRVGKYLARFSFEDRTGEGRSLTLISSNFNPTDQEPNPGVIIPNPTPEPGADPYAIRVFSILDEVNTIDLPVTVGIYVRRADGVYENIGGLILVYLSDSLVRANTKIINAKAFPDYTYGDLTFNSRGDVINFVWGSKY